MFDRNRIFDVRDAHFILERGRINTIRVPRVSNSVFCKRCDSMLGWVIDGENGEELEIFIGATKVDFL